MAKEKNVEFLPFDYFPFTVSDFSTELRRIYEVKKADYVWLRGGPAHVGVIMKDAARLGLKDKMKWIAMFAGYSEITPQIAGKETVAGMLFETSIALDTDDFPGVKLAKKIHSKYRTAEVSPMLYMHGIHVGMVAHESTKRTLEKVGLKKMGGRAIADQVWGLKNFDVGGIVPPITMEKGNICLTRSIRMAQVDKEGKLRAVSDWIPTPTIVGQ